MKTNYDTMTFEHADRLEVPFWYGGPRRLGKYSNHIVFIQKFDGIWQAQCGYGLTAAEHRDIADFLDQLNASQITPGKINPK